MKKSLRQKGFTLIEMLIGLAIFAIVLLSFTGLMEVVQSSNAYAHRFLAASFLSKAQVETLYNLSFSAAALNPTADWTPHPGPELVSFTGRVTANGPFSRQWRIVGVWPLKTIEVRTQWSDSRGKVHEVSHSATKGTD